MKAVIQRVRRAMLLRDGAGMTDAELLRCFIEHGDQAAFEALTQFHGPMVWGVCRRVLGNYHDAEEALQATFLVLARKAAAIAPPEMVGNWLYGVARRTALKAKVARSKRHAREREVTEMPEPHFSDELNHDWSELEPLLDRELARMPQKYRAPMVLCDLEGKTHQEAARHLGWPEGTVSVRIMRGRSMLAKRLRRCGLTLSAGTLSGLLMQNAATATAPSEALATTVHAAGLSTVSEAITSGLISQPVASLAEGVLMSMFVTKLKQGAIVAASIGAVTLGVGGLIYQMQAAEPTQRPVQVAAAATAKSEAEPETTLKYHDGKADGKKSLGGSG
jgi:RNA polymerase sigma factor (sigma-70 family)